MRLRFLPYDVFGVIQAFVLLSLIYAPMPFAWGLGGMTPIAAVTSTAVGVVLAFLLLTSALGVGVPFSVYRRVGEVSGLLIVMAAIVRLPANGAMIVFVCLGSLLFFSCLTVETGERRTERIPRKIETETDTQAEDGSDFRRAG